MDPVQLMRINQTNFTKSELKIMKYAIENLEEITSSSLIEFSKATGSSKSAVLRFCQKIGYTGYSQFKYAIRHYLSTSTPNLTDEHDGLTVASIYADTIREIDNFLDYDAVLQLKKMMYNARKIKIFGYAETGLTAEFLGMRLIANGIDCEVIRDLNLLTSKVQLSSKQDLLIFLSLSANTSVIKEAIDFATECHFPTALVTQNFMTSLKDKVDCFILLPFFKDNPDVLVLDSQVILHTFCMTLLNILIQDN